MMTKTRLVLTLKFAVSGLLIWFLFDTIDLGVAIARLKDTEPKMVMLAIAICLAQVVLASLRWRTVLRAIGADIGFAETVRIYFIGTFFNQTLPSSIGGDAVRIYVTHRAGLTLSGSINGIMLERAATIVALVVVVAAMHPFFQTRVSGDLAAWMFAAIVLAAVATVGGLGVLMILDRLPTSFSRWMVVRGLTYLAADARKVFLAPAPLCKTVGWGVVGHLNLSLAVFVLAIGLSLDVTMLDCVTLVPPIILLTTLPISIAGWGVRESAMVSAFGFVGTAPESALVLSIVFGLVVVVSALPGGVVWLMSTDIRGTSPTGTEQFGDNKP